MHHLEELVTHAPNGAMRHESEPCLKNKSNYARPIEQQAFGKMGLHVIPMNVVYDKWECMKQGEDEKRIGDPSMEDLEPLMRNTGDQGDPVSFTRSGAGYSQHERALS